MSNQRARLGKRRLELVVQSAALRAQLAEDSAAIRRKIDVGTRLLSLLPLLRSVLARLRR